MSKKLTTNQFIIKAQKIHGDLYDYSKVIYKNNCTAVCLIDPSYGEFWQEPHVHLRGSGNPLRNKDQQRTSLNNFIKRAEKVHNNLYDYSRVQYKNCDTDVCIIDPDHGEFWQTPYNHLSSRGSPVRAGNKQLTNATFIEKATKIHGKLYNYSKIKYVNAHTKVCIIDPVYGEFWQASTDHLSGKGCPKRAYGKLSVHKDHIIPLSIISRNDKERPLYKFLNSPINIQEIPGGENNAKSDWIKVNGKQVRARHLKNDYKIIAMLSENLLNTDISLIIEEDKLFR